MNKYIMITTTFDNKEEANRICRRIFTSNEI